MKIQKVKLTSQSHWIHLKFLSMWKVKAQTSKMTQSTKGKIIALSGKRKKEVSFSSIYPWYLSNICLYSPKVYIVTVQHYPPQAGETSVFFYPYGSLYKPIYNIYYTKMQSCFYLMQISSLRKRNFCYKSLYCQCLAQFLKCSWFFVTICWIHPPPVYQMFVQWFIHWVIHSFIIHQVI